MRLLHKMISKIQDPALQSFQSFVSRCLIKKGCPYSFVVVHCLVCTVVHRFEPLPGIATSLPYATESVRESTESSLSKDPWQHGSGISLDTVQKRRGIVDSRGWMAQSITVLKPAGHMSDHVPSCTGHDKVGKLGQPFAAEVPEADALSVTE